VDFLPHFFIFFTLEKSSFLVMIAPLAPTLHHQGRGRIAMPRYYLNRKFIDDCEQVIRHNRNWGMPQRREHACISKRASELFKGNPKKNRCRKK
jgi:hypothetical protein